MAEVETTIWKFPLELTDSQSVQMPKGARILHVGLQHRDIHIWAEVSPNAESETRFFEIRGTGHPIEPMSKQHLGTVFIGVLVFHIFERNLEDQWPK